MKISFDETKTITIQKEFQIGIFVRIVRTFPTTGERYGLIHANHNNKRLLACCYFVSFVHNYN